MNFEDILKTAKQGNAEEQFQLGLIYNNGDGVPRDDTKALIWFREVLEQGHTEAQFNLGQIYSNGEGVQQDYDEAIDWFEKTAEQGNEKI